ncbi:MAG: trypsin-like serine protease [Bdellovibrionales bacterium]|nr:trypsin-like serine protease [Bdellovibrionales bacterium]
MRAVRQTRIPKRVHVKSQAAGLIPSLSLLLLGLAIYSFAHAGETVIGEGATRVKDKDYPSLCHIEIEVPNSDEEGIRSCSGTLVGPNEIATGAHCFKKDFEFSYSTVRASCGGKSVTVIDVALPASTHWMNNDRPYPNYDYAKLTLKKNMGSWMSKAPSMESYFAENGAIKTGTRCWVGGFGNSPSGSVGVLYIAEVTKQKIEFFGGMITLKDPAGGVLKTSVDHGDSGGSFYCQAPGKNTVELVGVIVSYFADKKKDSKRMENDFAPIWIQNL